MTLVKNKALFLDRDGVINHDSGYTSSIDNFKFIDGIFDLCRYAENYGYLLIVVTNQAGIGRGYYSEQDFIKLTSWMCHQFELQGINITDVFFCPDHAEHGIGIYKKESFDRKPNPGMFLKAAEKHAINFSQSIVIGDKSSDMNAAKKAGVFTRCHFMGASIQGEMSCHATHKIQKLEEGISLLIKKNE